MVVVISKTPSGSFRQPLQVGQEILGEQLRKGRAAADPLDRGGWGAVLCGRRQLLWLKSSHRCLCCFVVMPDQERVKIREIEIVYNFIGVLDLPEGEKYPDNVVLDSRQGAAIEYFVGKVG